MENMSIYQYVAPQSTWLEPPLSSQPIFSDSYELRPSFITKVQEHILSRDEKENPYIHLREFKQVCSCLRILGMSQETLKWKLFPFSLMGLAKLWYTRNVWSVHGEWEVLQTKFCIAFLPISRVAQLHHEVLNFQQKEKETLGVTEPTNL